MYSANPPVEPQQSQNVACSECRRLRLQCDKRTPCKSCLRRGCPELCPKGSKSTADGTRAVLAATKELHETVKGLRDRIRDLETALNGLHVQRTGHTHPMLASAQVDQDFEEVLSSDMESITEQLNPMQKVALVRGRDGAHRIAAAHGRIWVTHSVADYPSPSSAPGVIDHARIHYPGIQLRRWPFAPAVPVPSTTITGLQQRIPANDVLDALLNVFLQSLGSTGLVAAFSENYIRDVMIPHAKSPLGGPLAATGLASLFSVLAIGSLFAVEGDEAPEVAYYGDLSAAAMVGLGTLSSPSVEAIEGLWLRSLLEFLRQDKIEERARVGMALVAQLCLILGLHRESTPFHFPLEVIERRRTVFWMVFKTDVWESLCIGRPGLFTSRVDFIDTKLPGGTMPGPDSGGDYSISSFALVVEMIATATLSLKPPSYHEILRLDHIVRNLDRRGRLIMMTTSAAIPPPNILLLYLHRAFYVRALREHSEDPHKSEYYYSFNAVLRAARDTLTWANTIFRQSPGMCARLYWIWSIAVTATMVYAVMLELAPACEFARESRTALNSSLELFQLGVTYGSGRARQALTMFDSIRELGRSRRNGANSDMSTLRDNTATTSLSSSLATISDSNLHDRIASSSEQPIVVGKQQPRTAQYSVGLSKQPNIGRIHRSRDRSQLQKLGKDINILHDTSVSTGLGNRHIQDSQGSLLPGIANPSMNGGSPFPAPWPLWKGHGWEGMNQSPMELSVPDGPESLGNFGPAVPQRWLESLGMLETSWTGGLNGEWAAFCQLL